MVVKKVIPTRFVRAISIKEIAFTGYHSFLVVTNSLQLFLIWKYKDRKITAL